MLGSVLGVAKTADLTSLVLRALKRKRAKGTEPIRVLGLKMETAIARYLPPRAI
jgi:hypothetical protein